MNKQEAITFYTRKRDKARNGEAIRAYTNILALLSNVSVQEAIEILRLALDDAGMDSIPVRRSVYRKALGELNI